MKVVVKTPKPRNIAAKALAEGQYRPKVVRDRTKYSRKGRRPSTRKFEDSIQLANGRWLIDSGEHR